MLKHVMRARDAFQNPAFALQTALYIAAVGEHLIQVRMSRLLYRVSVQFSKDPRLNRSRRVQTMSGGWLYFMTNRRDGFL
jgi:hypothetical protein